MNVRYISWTIGTLASCLIPLSGIAGEKEVAFSCLDNAAAKYALASCEPSSTILTAAEGACSNEVFSFTKSIVNSDRYHGLTLDQRLEIADRIIAARSKRLTAIVIEARARGGKSC